MSRILRNAEALVLANDGCCLLQTLSFNDAVSSLAVSRGGSLLACGTHDGSLLIIDREPAVPDTAAAIDLPPTADGAAAGDRREGVMRLEPKHGGRVLALAFSPGGSLVASASEDRTVRLWDARQGQMQFELTQHKAPVWAVVFSDSGHLLFSGGMDDRVNIWDPHTGDLIDTFHHDTVHGILSVAVSPREDLVAEGSFDHTIRLWSIAEGSRVHRQLERLRMEASRREFNLFRSRAGQVRLRQSKEFARLEKFKYFGAEAEQAPEETQKRNSSPLGQNHPTEILQGHTGTVASLQFSFDGAALCSGSHDGTVILWDCSSWQMKHKFTAINKTPVWACSLSADATLLAFGCGDGSIEFWDPAQGTLLLAFQGHSSYVTECNFSSDSLMLVSASEDSRLRLWKLLPTANLLKKRHAALREEQKARQASNQDQSRKKEQRASALLQAELEADRLLKEQVQQRRQEQRLLQHKKFAAANQRDTMPDEDDEARRKALEALLARREEELQREKDTVGALELAERKAQEQAARKQQQMLRIEHLRRRQQQQGLQPLAILSGPTPDMLYVNKLHQRLRQLYQRLGRQPVGDTHLYRKAEELTTYDAERQLHFEQVLLRTLNYEAFNPVVLDELADNGD